MSLRKTAKSYEFFNWDDIPLKDKEILHEALRNGSDCVELPWQDEDEPDCLETEQDVPCDQSGILGCAGPLDPETALGSPLQETFDMQAAYMQPQPIYPPPQYSPSHHHPHVISQEMVCDYSEQSPPPQPAMALEGMGKRSTGRRGHRNKSVHHTPRPDLGPHPPSLEVMERIGEPVRHMPITYAGGQSVLPFPSYPPHPVIYMYYGPPQGPHALPFVTTVAPLQPHVAMPSAMAGEPLAPSHFTDPHGPSSPKEEEVASSVTTVSQEAPIVVEEEGNFEPEEVVAPAVIEAAPEASEAPPVKLTSPAPCNADSIPKADEPAVEPTQAATPVERPTAVAPVVNGSSPAMRSWADLFKKGSGGTARTNKLHSAVPATSDCATSDCNEELRTKPGVPESGDNKLGSALHKCTVDHTPPMIQPRGLENGKNWCYINANLQALLACPAFYNLLHSLPLVPGMPGSTATPLMECLIFFLQSYAIPLVRETGKKDELVIGSAYDPEPFRDLLMKIKPDCKKGKQEDAEEFLSFMLNGLHDEMVSSMQSVSNGLNGQCNGEDQAPAEHLDDDDEGAWKTVSHRNRHQVTRSAEYSRSPLMDIFGGEMRSSVTADGETSASLQPFFTLQLDIQDGVKTVEEALLHLAAEEKVQNYHSSKSNKEVDASRRTTLEKLPQVLILHLKRFVYDKNGGCKKLMNAIQIPHQLQLDRKLVSSGERVSSKQRCYKLFAVLSHSGERTDKGHYVTDAYHPAGHMWLRCDDDNVTPIAQGELLRFENSSLVPYLLFYRRADTDHQPR